MQLGVVYIFSPKGGNTLKVLEALSLSIPTPPFPIRGCCLVRLFAIVNFVGGSYTFCHDEKWNNRKSNFGRYLEFGQGFLSRIDMLV